MNKKEKRAEKDELKSIPWVGDRTAEDLHSIGIHKIKDLKGADPEELYLRLCVEAGGHVDRCMLYVLRYAVYFVSHKKHKPELLKWWNWK